MHPLRQWRQDKGLSLAQAAKACGLTDAMQFMRYERGRIPREPATVKRIEFVTGVGPEALYRHVTNISTAERADNGSRAENGVSREIAGAATNSLARRINAARKAARSRATIKRKRAGA